MLKLMLNSIYLLLAQASALLIPLFLLPLLTRYYGLSDVALYIFSVSVISFSYLIFDFGLSTYGIKKSAEVEYCQAEISKLFSITLTVKFFFFLLVFLVVGVIFYINQNNSYIKVVVFSFISIFFQSLIPYWLFQSINKMKVVTLINVASRLSSIIISVFFVFFGFDIYSVILATGFGWVIASCVSLKYLNSLGYTVSVIVSREPLISFFKEVRDFYLSRLAVSSYLYSNVFILSTLSAVNLAVYGVADYIYKIIQSLVSVVTQALFPQIAESKDYTIFFKTLFLLLLFIFIIGLFFKLYSHDVIQLLYGPSYLLAIPFIEAFIVLALFNVLSVIFGYPAASLFSKYDYVNYSSYFCLIVYFFGVVVLYLLNAISPLHLIYILIASEISTFLWRLSFFVKYYKLQKV